MRRNEFRILRPIFFALLIFSFLSCSSSEAPSVKSSGDKDLDKSAQYALFTIRKLEKRGGFEKPSEAIEYMTSTIGSAELTPPSETLEPDMAAYYKGPRPANSVAIVLASGRANPFFKKQIALSARDEDGIVVAEAFVTEEEGEFYIDESDPVFTWEWTYGK